MYLPILYSLFKQTDTVTCKRDARGRTHIRMLAQAI